MHLLYCDETNLEERAGDFLIYGGLLIDANQAQILSAAIDDLRNRRKVPRDFRLKFNPGPGTFTHQQFIDLKQEVLELATAHGARLIAYVVLHDIATNADEARRNGINTVCFHFHCILNRIGGPGLVLIDRFNDAGNVIDAHLRDKFTTGLTGLPYSDEMRLPNIIGFHYSTIGQSHFPSIVDIALGSLRFSLNAHTHNNAQHQDTARRLLGLLSPMFWREAAERPIPELGFIFSPKVIKSAGYRARYESLKAYLAASGVVTEQKISDQRMY